MPYVTRFIFAAALFLASCGGPDYKPSLEVPEIVPIIKNTATVKPRHGDAVVYIHQFSDARTAEAIAEYDGREVKPAGDVIDRVVRALRGGLQKKGYRFAENAPVLIAGEIRKWMANISGGFKARVDAQAAVSIDLIDPANKRVFSGIYQGYANMEKSGMEDKDVQETLSVAMAEALGRMLSDPQFNRMLSSY